MACVLSLAPWHEPAADTTQFSVAARFIKSLSLANINQPDFGLLDAGPAGRQFILGTNGGITGTDAAAYQGGAVPGSMDISGSDNQSVDIIAANSQPAGGIDIINITCNYGDSGDQDCGSGITSASPPGTSGTQLLLGLEINTTREHLPGETAAPTFDVIVSYH